MYATKLDISSENFDLYFAQQAEGMTTSDKETIPNDLLFRLFNRGGALSLPKLSKMNFFSKMFMLWKMRHRIFIVVEAKEGGMNHEQFIQMREYVKKRDASVDRAQDNKMTAAFVLGSKELCDTFAHLNRICGSGAYNYLMRVKNMPRNKTTENREHLNYIMRFICNFEGSKKKWVEEKKITIPEFLVLTYVYDKVEVLGSIMYKSIFRRAYQSSPNKIKAAFGTLQTKGYLRKTGEGRGAKLSITPLGVELMDSILDKYIINC